MTLVPRLHHLRRGAVAALLLPLTAALGPAVADAAQPKAKDVRWRIVKVDLDGYSSYRGDDGDVRMTLDGKVKYRTTKPLRGKPFVLKTGVPDVAQVKGGISWSTTNTGTLSNDRGSWSCPFSAEQDAGIAGIMAVRGKRVTVQWSLAPGYMKCPQEAPDWSFGQMPIEAMQSSFRRSLLDARKKRVKIPIEISRKWDDAWHTKAEVLWDGHVTFERVLR